MIEAKHLNIGYRKTNETNLLIEDLNFSFRLGEFIGIEGDNGIGKSSLLKTLYGHLKPISGEILINQKNIQQLSSFEIARFISIVVTDKVSGFNLKVKDVVSAGRIPYLNRFAKLSLSDEKVIQESLHQMQIEHLSSILMEELSDGQRQKVMIAKSLAQECPIIILDEPTAFLDYRSKQKLFMDLKNLAEQCQKLILISTHDLELMHQHVHKVLSIEHKNKFELKSKAHI
jgi:iron complex transport system ATP-binding protein